ncbi:TPA: hypothetical protein NJ073_004649 [Vibrio parahaemolyticus]|nr:hypothetical protein [Vibrio parahaemolyticus]HCG7963908.1 hypothetical protein [Vibrio parahaemolyticus]
MAGFFQLAELVNVARGFPQGGNLFLCLLDRLAALSGLVGHFHDRGRDVIDHVHDHR